MSDVNVWLNSTQEEYNNLSLQEVQQTQIIESFSIGQAHAEPLVGKFPEGGAAPRLYKREATPRRYFKSPLCRGRWQALCDVLATSSSKSQPTRRVDFFRRNATKSERVQLSTSQTGRRGKEKPKHWSSKHGLLSASSGCGELISALKLRSDALIKRN